MTIATICFGVLALALWTIIGARIVREPRHTGYGMAILAGIVVTWIFVVLLASALSPESDLADIAVFGPVMLVFVAVFAVSIYLLINAVIVVRREGLRVATLVPAVFGVFLLIVLVATVATAIALVTVDSYTTIALLVPFVVIPIAILVTALFGYTAYALVYSRVGRPMPSDAVIVLGAGLAGDKVTPLLAARIDRGIEMLDAAGGPDHEPLLVMSGGKGSDEVLAEAEAMARYAIDAGVDEHRIVREDTSTTTEENLINSRAALAEIVYPAPSLTVVTSDFHVLRAASLTRRLGLDATVVGAPTARYYVPAGFLREFTACLVHYRRANLILWAAGSCLVWAMLALIWYLSGLQTEVEYAMSW
ncbi:YdcF family protein [Gordonia sp. HY002]|uniref:YdcF family protein n=1 Tax=Gordonia zhenghanii TaxID=2911516 RepID=UPI001EF08253|nr:YdcF family protein [Gordonia zhenghanii]MCF8571539.1 YdcF family protein [Gordonia zhenghanii]MCF8605760.1 YdcF family protein [Gordonia zhenghanii]